MSYADDTGSFEVDDMSRHVETNAFAIAISAILGAAVPNYVIDTAGKIVLAFTCGFASLAGQALWRMAVSRIRTRTRRGERS